MRWKPDWFRKIDQWTFQNGLLNTVQQVRVVNVANSALDILQRRPRVRPPRGTDQPVCQTGPLIHADRSIPQLLQSQFGCLLILSPERVRKRYRSAQCARHLFVREFRC